MKAYTRYVYGGPEVMKLEEVSSPVLHDDHVLVRVMANSANPADWHILRGDPFFARFTFGLFKPKSKLTGSDFAGVVEAVGSAVTNFKAGDRVMGSTLKGGAFAEYISLPANSCGLIPGDRDFTEMACLPISGITALQALTTHGQVKKGERVLINGASGGVGHLAVQIAKAYGAHVTAVCSTRSADFVKQLGADELVLHNSTDIHQHNGFYDLVVDIHGNLSYQDHKRMGHRSVLVGFTTMRNMISVLLKAAFGRASVKQFTAHVNTSDLQRLTALVDQDKIKVHVHKVYPAEQIPEAIASIETMRTQGKVAMTWENSRYQ